MHGQLSPFEYEATAKKYLNFMSVYIIIRQGTVDNNLGPDRLAGPKALDPNYCRQPTL